MGGSARRTQERGRTRRAILVEASRKLLREREIDEISLTDVADAGARFTIKVGDTLFSDLLGASGRLANGSIQFVRILLPATVTNLTVELRNSRRNDGFGIDRASVGRVAPVPLPPAALLLVSAAGALVALRRRRTA